MDVILRNIGHQIIPIRISQASNKSARAGTRWFLRNWILSDNRKFEDHNSKYEWILIIMKLLVVVHIFKARLDWLNILDPLALIRTLTPNPLIPPYRIAVACS